MLPNKFINYIQCSLAGFLKLKCSKRRIILMHGIFTNRHLYQVNTASEKRFNLLLFGALLSRKLRSMH